MSFFKNFKRTISKALLLTVGCLTMGNAIPAQASQHLRATVNKIERLEGYVKDKTSSRPSVGMWYMKIGNEYGNTVYCMNYLKQYPDGSHDYPDNGGKQADDKAYSILKYGYPYVSAESLGLEDYREAYQATQIALWTYTDLDKINVNNLVSISGAKGERIISAAKNIYNKAMSNPQSQQAKLELTPENSEATLQGDEFVAGPFSVNVTGGGKWETYKAKLIQSPSSAYTCDVNGNKKTTFNNNEQFYVRFSKTEPTGSFKVGATVKTQFPVGLVYESYSSSVQDMIMLADDVQNPSNDKVSISWKEALGNLKVIKTGDNGEFLTGAKFQLKDLDGNVVAEKISENGELTFEGLKANEYILEEVESPKGFLKAEPVKVVVRAGETAEINVVNEQIKGRIQVKKVDEETGEPLEGASFDIEDKTTGQVVENITTNEQGIATSGLLPFGDYIVKEIKAPNKYTLNGKEYPVTITEHMQTIEITHSNRIIKGRVAINKFDSEFTDLKLEGAEFTIYDKNDNEVDKLITDKNGYDESIDLNYGDYYMKETKAPIGYKLSDKVYDIQIREDKKVYTFDVPNDVIKGQIQIVKVDSENEEKPVEGAGFDVIAVNVNGIETGTVVDHVVTNKDGFAFTKPLRYGEYKFVETDTPEGYWQSDREYHINITEDNKTYVKYVKNEPIQAKLRVVKTDSEDGQPLEGVKFQVRNTDTNELVTFKNFVGILPVPTTTLTTDKNGEIMTPQPLAYGEYQLEEVKAKEGYIGIEPIPFKIDENAPYEDIKDLGTIYTIKVSNDRLKGDMELLKIDSETKEPLADVNFKITCEDGFMKDQTWELKSDENGIVSLKDLEYGKYRIDEVSTLWNYVLNKEPLYFEIKENGQVVKLEMENKKIRADVELIKIDADTKRPLEGAEFELWNGEKLVGTYTTNKDGKISLENLEAGNYYWNEIKAPEHYEINQDQDLSFVIDKDGETKTVTAENKVKTGEVDFVKTDVTTGENIEGAKIEIVGLEEHNKHIKIEFDSSLEGNKFKVPVGKYQFKETQAPNGYELSTEVGEFEVKADEVIKAELKNERTTGVLEFIKTDSKTGEGLDGAKIKIECLEGLDKGKVIEFTSSKEGNKFTLAKGKYRISEIQAPEGYELTTETGEFEITEHGQVVKCNLTNKKFEIVKTGGAFNVNMMLPLGILLVAGSVGALAFTKRKRA
ncbi:SpaA isopeptide-forming pilin-related protein [Clostridium perfringens]|uniref:SpaA isopeptide-forming pilin-related protein n=1 Tax=Clostridium perfringens TaxID=1502 RepID=UPI000D70FB3D|nr:SpaA isopeptide-forming pilin-related protein [Clostridium perfringens]MBO3424422.1 Cys-Gln thioester bond-forming surface protein [Clostridium perfringens]PWX10398.1 adhesin [Clostridium perfringens]PWX37276.1 adhesin [Clostridium perfringens]PWX59089.1 adhesin [Clostridium perfringens]